MKIQATTNKKGTVQTLLGATLSLFLILTLSVPTWAVVFTNASAITINDATTIGIANPYPSNITVSGMTGTITNVTMTLSNLNHTFPDDFDMLLVSPSGGNLIVLSDVGGSDDVYFRTITLDDAAAGSLPDATTLLSGTFKPTNIGAGDTFPAPAPAPSANTTFAAAFNGTDPNGTWSLYVVDDLGVDVGPIGNGWSLTVTTTGSPATFTNGAAILNGDGARGRATPYGSPITSSGLTGAITSVKITLTNLNHLNPDDLDIMLLGPTGKRILLLSDAGGTTDVVAANVTFDDAAATGVPDAGPLVSGTFRPTNFGTGDTLPDLLPPYPNSPTAGSANLASVFNGTEPNGTWKLYIVDDATTSAGTLDGGWSIDVTAGGTYGSKRFTSADFDGDGKSDTAVFRPSNGTWYLRDSYASANRSVIFGASTDRPVPGDYDGDNKNDVATFRPSNGTWYLINSSNSTFQTIPWGAGTDLVAQNDYDADGKTDLAVYRPSTGVWYVRQSTTGTSRAVTWGASTDVPVRGYFNGTNGADFTVFRPSTNTWYILNNAESSSTALNFGATGDVLAPADFDGDGKTDIAVFRPSTGDWYIQQSSTGSTFGIHWGMMGDIPVPSDYDADSKADVAVWRNGTWYVLNSGTPPGAAAIFIDYYGDVSDTPLANTYLPQ